MTPRSSFSVRDSGPERDRSGRAVAGVLGLILIASLFVGGGLAGYDWWTAMPAGLTAEYVGSQSCVECHQLEYDLWTGSEHDLAMAEPTRETVLGDFRDVTFEYHGITSRIYREGFDYFMATDGPDGEVRPFEIIWTFGIEPLQQYLVRFEDGRVQCLPIAWDTLRKEWFHLYPDEKIDYEDPLHWTKPAQNWNYMCADCHSTNVWLNFDGETNTYHTSFDEINVSCESCHGPGSLHNQIAESRKFFWDRRYDKGLTVTLKDADNVTMLNACAKCHSRRSPMYPGMTPGDEFLDYYAPELIANDLYFDDGQILDEVYVWGSFLQSKMYAQGVKCTDCHDAHTTRLKFQDNRLCLQCHELEVYDVVEHHHHPEGRVGASCIDCHMLNRTYMQVDPRRDHSFRIPRPDLTIAYGSPNTCNVCHYDKEAQWALDAMEEWYGKEYEPREHFAHAFHAGKEGRKSAEKPLREIVADRERPGIIRASAMSLLRHYQTEPTVSAVKDGLDDDEPLVRWAAVQTMSQVAPQDLATALGPRLRDPIRIIRMETAQALSAVPQNELSATERQALAAAVEEYERGQLEAHEPVTSRFNLGVIYTNLRQTAQAREMYRQSIRIDPEFLPARFNLAMLEYAEGRASAAERELRAIIEVAPDDADAHFSLGVLLWELEDRREDALAPLAEAARLAPERAEVRYNYGLALQHLGRNNQAEEELLAAVRAAPEDTAVLYALAIFYAQNERWPEARVYTERLLEVQPGHPTYLRLRGEIEARSRGSG